MKTKLGRRPEDVFGNLSGSADDQLTQARLVYRRLARELHPDAGGDEEEFKHLNELWEQARRLIDTGLYGARGSLAQPVVFTSKRGKYTAVREADGGDVCRILETDDERLVKIVRHPRDNDLVANEARVLKHLKAEDKYDQYFNYLPDLVDSFGVRRARVARRANVFENLRGSGFLDLEEIVDRMGSLDPKHIAWLFRRVLVILGVAHRSGVVHGAVLPEHLLIHPTMHGLVLVDWCYSVIDPKNSGERIKAIVPARRDFYPKEVLEKKPTVPEVDIYMAAKSMLYALDESRPGGRQFKAFFQGCTLPLQKNPEDAWGLKTEFTEMIDRLWTRKYIPLEVPAR